MAWILAWGVIQLKAPQELPNWTVRLSLFMKPNKPNRPEMYLRLQVYSDQVFYMKTNVQLFIRSLVSFGFVRDFEKDSP